MKRRLRVFWLLVLGVFVGKDLWASQSPQPNDRLQLAIQEALRLAAPPNAPPKRFGVFTLSPPETRGEIVRITLPVGELAMRGARAVSNARDRRAERKAREEVQQALKEFLAQQK